MKRSLAPLALLALLLPLAAGCESPAGDASLEEAAAPLSAEAQSAFSALPAEANFLAAADVQALRQGGIFDSTGQRNVTGETGARLKDFFDATGFDPAKDVQKVYVAAPLDENAAPQMAVAADFDRARFQEQLAGELGDDFEKTTHRGQPLYRSTREDRSFSFALTDGGLILLAPRVEGVRRMIDRLEGQAPSIGEKDAIMRLADRVRGRGNTWFAVRGLKNALHTERDSTESRFKRVKQILRSAAGAVSMDENTAEGELLLYTQDGAAPADLEEVLEGVVAALKKRDDLPADKRRALESVEISREGDAVRVRFTLPRSAFEE